ncbi:hypothetical protein AB3S75_033424 [Citrus x aurantiifolia]
MSSKINPFLDVQYELLQPVIHTSNGTLEEIPFVGISTRERPFIEAEAPDPTESEELRTPFQKQKLRDSSPLPFFWKAVLGTLNARSTSLMTDP